MIWFEVRQHLKVLSERTLNGPGAEQPRVSFIQQLIGPRFENFPLAFRASLVVSFSSLEGVAFRGSESGAGGLDFQQ